MSSCCTDSAAAPCCTDFTVLPPVGPPKIRSDRKQYARYGKMGRVTCDVHSLPKPESITWLRDGQPIDVKTQERYACAWCVGAGVACGVCVG